MIYDNFLKLCNNIGKTPSAAALDMGLSKTTVNRWKNGGGVTDATALIVANYFGITVEELKTGVKKEPSVPKDEKLDKNDALLETYGGLSEGVFVTYDNFSNLCNSIGKSPSAVALELGISKSTVSHWKHQRNEMTAATALKIANYFGITVEELKTGVKKEPSVPKDEELDKNNDL